VRDYVVEAAGFKFDGVTVVPLGFIDKTSSGKARRLPCRRKLLGLMRSGDAPPTLGHWPLAAGEI
jgi:hypothetical protein